jgi:ribosomal protein S25
VQKNKHSQTWAQIVPRGLAREILEELNNEVSLRLVYHVLAEKGKDHHGIIEIAIRKLKEKEIAAKKLANQKSKIAHSLKSK